jgi:hypothetical protein
LVDTGRNSLDIEIKTMKKIKDQLFLEYPYTRELLNPIQYYNVNDISINGKITSTYNTILQKKHIGIQYERLARLCDQIGILNMHLSIEKPLVLNEKYWDFQLDKLLCKTTVNSQIVYKIDSQFKETEEFKLFKYFIFPIRNLSKIQMALIAKEKGWNNIINLTWFCHNPYRKLKPCGRCKPCLMVINEGFGWRIPIERRVISLYYRKIYWPIKSIVKSILHPLGLRREVSQY